MKSNFDGSSSKYASVLSDFVEEQKNKDLLDVSHGISRSECILYTNTWVVVDATNPPIAYPLHV